MQVNTNLSRNLHNIVRAKGISQAYICKQLGAKTTTVNGWFRGANVPRYDMLEKLAKVLGVTTQDLLSDNFDYNSTIANRNNVQSATATVQNNATVLPKEGYDNMDPVMGKTPQFWQILALVDTMPVAKQKEVLDIVKAISKH